MVYREWMNSISNQRALIRDTRGALYRPRGIPVDENRIICTTMTIISTIPIRITLILLYYHSVLLPRQYYDYLTPGPCHRFPAVSTPDFRFPFLSPTHYNTLHSIHYSELV